jgi:hypothetical protein
MQNLESRLKKLFQLQVKMEGSREYSEGEIKDSVDQLCTFSFDQECKIKVEENLSDLSPSAAYKEEAQSEMEDNAFDPLSFDECVIQENKEER